MSTYKRRIVYLSDPEWEHLGQLAKQRKATISATIRDMLVEPVRGEQIAREALAATPVRTIQSQRDDLLRKINRG
jgi:macrodomain Ter protein organizer (MatP/YcbG family)